MRAPWTPTIAATLALLALVGVSPAHAGTSEPGPRGADAFDGDDPRVEAELLVDAEALRPGQTVRVGVLLVMDPGWHVYWRNSGESGLPTELEWDFPDAALGPLRWPAPRVFEESDGFLTTYGYGDRVLLSHEARISEGARGRARIAVTADFVTCHIGCIPGRIELLRELPVASVARPAPEPVTALFDAWEARLPEDPQLRGLQLEVLHSQREVRPGDDFRSAIRVRCPDGAAACAGLHLAAGRDKEAFLPEAIPTVEIGAVAQQPEEDGFTVVLAGHASPDDPGRFEQRLRGLLPVRFAERGPVTHLEVDLPLPRGLAGQPAAVVESPLWTLAGGFDPAAGAPDAATAGGTSLLVAFGLALLGGLILNLMPCVLPVLALKVFHVAELAHRSRREVVGHGAAYTGGVLASMGALAAIVLGLRAAGTAVGWGFQFQEPLFVAGMATVLVVFALNLFGVFEVTLQPAGAAFADATGYRRSFFEGLLAVVLATPCTAPFLGTAVGFAFASSAPVVVVLFLAIGVGLAAPYAAVSLVPAWARVIPRPGSWMVAVRCFLGFCLIGTVVWLLWVLGRSVGVDAQAAVLGYLVGVGFLTWVFGGVQRGPRRRIVPATGLACLAIGLASILALPLEPQVMRPAAGAEARAEGGSDELAETVWRPYDMAAIQAELGRGRPVFVDFTADWCITCKVNEKVVLDDPRVVGAMQRLDVATFKADWTAYDDEIRRVLASFGKAGVPMYLLYRPEAPADPAVLPELLTVDGVLGSLEEAAGPARAAGAPGEAAEPNAPMGPDSGREEKS